MRECVCEPADPTAGQDRDLVLVKFDKYGSDMPLVTKSSQSFDFKMYIAYSGLVTVSHETWQACQIPIGSMSGRNPEAA